MHRFLGSRDDAEHAVQEAFIRDFNRINRLNHQSKFSTWLYRIAFNIAISEHRKAMSLNAPEERFGDRFADDSRKSVLTCMTINEERNVVRKALTMLGDNPRATLLLREFDDRSYEEIAQVLGITTETVRSRLARARECLREAIEALQANVNRQPQESRT